MERTVPAYETHSSSLWNAQFQSMKLSWNTIARRLRSARRALGTRIAGVSGMYGACFSPPLGERSAPVCGLVLPAAVGPERGRREKNRYILVIKPDCVCLTFLTGENGATDYAAFSPPTRKARRGKPRKGRPGHGRKNENTNL